MIFNLPISAGEGCNPHLGSGRAPKKMVKTKKHQFVKENTPTVAKFALKIGVATKIKDRVNDPAAASFKR